MSWLRGLNETLVHEGSCFHSITDHRKSDNPYRSKYGTHWEEEIRKTISMKQYICVRDLVEHIHDCSKETFAGKTHENTWYFYHDALKLMTAKSTVNWMKEQGYYK